MTVTIGLGEPGSTEIPMTPISNGVVVPVPSNIPTGIASAITPNFSSLTSPGATVSAADSTASSSTWYDSDLPNVVDNDLEAIKNSVRNIFSTRKGQKLLTPEFGSSLEQYLFEPITEIYARAIGDDILTSLEKYEPRIEVLKVFVLPNPDQNQYNISVAYKFLEFKKESVLNILAQFGGQISI